MSHRYLLAVAVVLTSGAVAEQQDSLVLEEIVVTATRQETTVRDAARSISIVDALRIQSATQQLALDESLAGIPGLYMQNRYNFSQDLRISMRGFGARSSFGIRGIRIFVDGIPETLPDGQSQVDSIDLGSANKIEVLRGPASALYGNASGGVIAIRSELGSSPPFVEGRVAAGDFGFRQYHVKTGGKFSDVDLLFNVSRRELDGYRDHSRFEGDMLNGKLGMDLSDNDRLVVALNFIDQPVALDPGSVDALQAESDPTSARARNVLFDAGESISQHRAGLHYSHTAANSELVLRGYYASRDFANRLPFVSGGAVELDRSFYGAGIQYSMEKLQDNVLRWTLGIDADRQDDRRLRFDNNAGSIGALVFDQNELVASTGAFLHGDFQLSESWGLGAGLRVDRVAFDIRDNFLSDGDSSGKIDFSEVSSSLSINYKFNSGVVFASFSTSFDTPTTTELANPDGSGGFNESLVAQTAANFEIGFKQSVDAFYYELAVFHISLEDELIPFELPAFPGRTFFTNAGESSRDGIEAMVMWTGQSGLKAQLSYTWSDFRFEEFSDDNGNIFSGNQLPGLPRHFGYAGLTYESQRSLYGTFELNYSGSLYANNANDIQVPSYLVGNLRFGYRGKTGRWLLEPYLGINNIFDERYNNNIRINAFGGRYYEPAPVRNYYAGIVIRFE